MTQNILLNFLWDQLRIVKVLVVSALQRLLHWGGCWSKTIWTEAHRTTSESSHSDKFNFKPLCHWSILFICRRHTFPCIEICWCIWSCSNISTGVEIFHLVLKYFIWCWNISSSFEIFYLVLKYFIWRQNISSGVKIFHLVLKYFIWCQNISSGVKIFHLMSKYFIWCQNISDPAGQWMPSK